MKILYIDVVQKVSKIRIAERAVFLEEMVRNGGKVDFLLRCPKKRNMYEADTPRKVYYYANNILSKFYLNFPLLISLLKIPDLDSYDFIICRNNISISLFPLIVSKFLKPKFIYIKAFPTDLSFLNLFKNSNNFIEKWVSGIRFCLHYLTDFFLIRLSNGVITRTNGFTKYLRKVYFIKHKNVFALPMGYKSSHFIKLTNTVIDKPSDIDSNYRYIGYFGTFAKERNITFIIKIITFLITTYPDIRLLLIGASDNEKESVNSIADKLGVSKYVVIIQELERYDLYRYLSCVEFTISAIPPLKMYKISSPTKVVESLGLGIPVIVNQEIEDQSIMIKESGCGIVVPYSVESFSRAAVSLLTISREEYVRISEKGKDYVRNNRSYSILTHDLINYLKKV